ncbi:ArnT family glycosyltransferase [Bounagaea algeriensis]
MSQATMSRSTGMPPLATWVVLLIAAVVALVHLAASFDPGYWFDEAYMLAIGRNHLDWGSADQPPVTPLLARLMDWIAPGSMLALRLPAVLATAAAVVVAALIAREFGGDRRAQVMTAGAQATALWAAMAGHWLAPYTLEPLQWLVLLWALVRWIRVRDDRLLLLLGAVAGIAAETKFQVLLLCAVLLLSVLVFGPRQLLRRPKLWFGGGIGALIALPTLAWQAVHGWPQLRMGEVVAAEAPELYGGRIGIAVALICIAGVAGTVLAVYGLWRLLRAEELRSYRFLAVTFLVLYVVFVATLSRPYYLGGFCGLLVAVGAVGLQRRREAGQRRRRWMAWPAFALSAAAAGGMLVSGFTSTDEYGSRGMQDSEASDSTGSEVAQRTAAAYRGLPEHERDRTAIMGETYIIAAYIDSYAPQYDLPKAHSSNRSYGYFPPPPETQDQVLYVGTDPAELRPHFTEVRRVDGAANASEASVWLGSGKREPWESLWPRLRHLDVS